MNEVPDTTEAVAKVLSWQCGGDGEIAKGLALFAIAAHRKALSDVGWVEAPKVKVSRANYKLGSHDKQTGWNACLVHLQSLGLPIELED